MSTADGSVTSSLRRIRSETFLLNSVKEVNSANLYCLIIVGRQRETCMIKIFVDRILSTRMITPIRNAAVEEKAYLPEKQ